MAIIGIDLGTTNSLVCSYSDGQVKLIPNAMGVYLTPSVVTIKDNFVHLGHVAKELQANHPSKSASAFKRFMGTDKRYFLESMTLTPVALSSMVLKRLVADAEDFLGEAIEEAVISVPAYFNDKQRRATMEAAHMAGLKVERLINEPTAAALAYHLNDRAQETVVAVVDLGGGTFDVSILDIFDSVVEVRAVSGDNYLGGEDFDEVLVAHLARTFSLKLEGLSLTDRARLKYAAEAAKIALTEQASVEIELPLMGAEYKATVTQSEFDNLCEPLLMRLREPLKKAVADSRFKLSDIDEVILVGGATRMPQVKRFIAKLFGKLPLCHLNPDEVVAMGAAVAAQLKQRHVDFEDTVLTDVCPFTLGTTVVKENGIGEHVLQYDPIIERNQSVPTSRVKRYYNASANQVRIAVDVYQGDSYKIENNLKLGELIVPIPKSRPHETAVDIRYTYDINGILEVEVSVPSTGVVEQAIIMNANQLDHATIQEQLAKIAHLKRHPKQWEENQFLLAKAERLYEMTLGRARQIVADETMLFEAALDSQDPETIALAVQRLKNFFEYMGWED